MTTSQEAEPAAEVREAVLALCRRFDLAYWRKRDETRSFPVDFVQAVADAGFLGIAMPQEVGGAALGMVEAATMMQAIAESGAGFSGASAVHMNIFGLNPVVKHGTPEQRRRFLPPLIKGQDRACFAVTESDSGLDTLSLKTRAVKTGDHYVVTGQKIWTSTAQVANKMLLLARTTPLDQCRARTQGLSLFYCDIDRTKVRIDEIEKMGRGAVDSNIVIIDGLAVPACDRIGEEGEGFRYLLDGLNPERILIGAEAIGLGRAALRRAVDYARERRVFSRPIGQNQGIQHPLAKCWMDLEAANLMVFKAAALYDRGAPCGAEANAGKYLAAEAGFAACERALMTHGGFGYAKDYHVERFLREMFIPRLAPVSAELILCFIAEKVLGLPKSY